MAIITKPLSSEELPIVGIIKALDSAITPRFSDWNKNQLYTQREAEFDDNPKRTRVPVASPETEFVVYLEKIGYSHGLPTTDQGQCDRLVVFSTLRMKKNPMAVEIHDIQRIETPVPFEVSWTEEVCLMDIVEIQRIGEIGVFHPFGNV